MNISIYTITSELHDKVAINQATKEFLGALDFEYDFKDSDYSTYGDADLNLIYVRTGGTEGVFKKIQPLLSAVHVHSICSPLAKATRWRRRWKFFPI